MCLSSRATSPDRLPRSVCGSRSWQLHRKRAAAARLALHLYRPTLRTHHKLHDTQSQPAAAGLARQPLVHLVEAPENFPSFARGDAYSVILHREDHVPVPREGLEDDVFFARRVLARIVQQVEQYGGERVLVDRKSTRLNSS